MTSPITCFAVYASVASGTGAVIHVNLIVTRGSVLTRGTGTLINVWKEKGLKRVLEN